MKKRWRVNPANKELQDALGRELNILPVTAQLLINRGLVDKDTALSFLSPDINALIDPFLLKGMDKAVTRIAEAVGKKERIAIYGDYDVDGTTATAVLGLFFKEIGVEPLCYIPERKSEGYGLNEGALRELKEKGASLVITVDCGSSNSKEVAFAKTLGLDCIVTDHHEVPSDVSAIEYLVNPMQEGCTYPFKGLCGAGVAFHLAIAIRTRLRERGMLTVVPNLKRYLDLVAIGTIADMVSLTGVNRVLVSHGLKELETTGRAGLRALKDVAGLRPGRVNAEAVAFQIAPRINAAGRMERADTALRLLITDDEAEASEIARKLNAINIERQAVEAAILGEAIEMLGPNPADRAIVLASKSWNQGVVGIVASRLVEKFGRPAVLAAIDGDIAKGSVRGVKGVNVLDGLTACADKLVRYGGHKAAAGITVEAAMFDAFKASYLEYMNSHITDDDLTPEVTLDCVVPLSDVNARMVTELERLAPFGRANERPLFCIEGARVMQSDLVRDKHLKLVLKQSGRTQSAIAYKMGTMHPVGGLYDVAFFPYIDNWNGNSSVCLNVKDLRPSERA
ncbi:MAG: single-stranded-DNA-specific exonuclease RecJ [Deltaproteobacteria bacterium]|nr:single-stranded-DNA-specific exonuclease RecJ [Deltaproteobacteria bacterium]